MAEPRFRKFKGCFMKTPLTRNLTLISRLYSIKNPLSSLFWLDHCTKPLFWGLGLRTNILVRSFWLTRPVETGNKEPSAHTAWKWQPEVRGTHNTPKNCPMYRGNLGHSSLVLRWLLPPCQIKPFVMWRKRRDLVCKYRTPRWQVITCTSIKRSMRTVGILCLDSCN